MSSALVDYGSSSEDDAEEPPEAPEPAEETLDAADGHASRNRAIASPGQSVPIRLPDATALFRESQGGGSTSRTATETSSKKRPELNGSAHLSPPVKLPRRSLLPSSRTSPDTAGGLLLPPQLRGRSNVVTDDMDKLFVRRRRDS